jgi:hypothetical protein
MSVLLFHLSRTVLPANPSELVRRGRRMGRIP